MSVFRGWKNLFFAIVLFCLLLLQLSFWLVNLGCVTKEAEVMEKESEAVGVVVEEVEISEEKAAVVSKETEAVVEAAKKVTAKAPEEAEVTEEEKGYSFDLPSMSGIGYSQIGMFLAGKMDLQTAIQQIKYETHQFARRQYTWFRLDDARIHWFDICDNILLRINQLARTFIESIKIT